MTSELLHLNNAHKQLLLFFLKQMTFSKVCFFCPMLDFNTVVSYFFKTASVFSRRTALKYDQGNIKKKEKCGIKVIPFWVCMCKPRRNYESA